MRASQHALLLRCRAYSHIKKADVAYGAPLAPYTRKWGFLVGLYKKARPGGKGGPGCCVFTT